MNWDAIGAIGEIIGALAVVGSLVYLASQIHASNLATKQASMQELMAEMTNFLGRLTATQETAATWMKGLSNPEDLTEGEQSQFYVLCLESTVVWERIHYLKKTIDVDEHIAHFAESSRKRTTRAPGYKRWFNAAKNDISADFREILEQDINQATEYVPLKVRW